MFTRHLIQSLIKGTTIIWGVMVKNKMPQVPKKAVDVGPRQATKAAGTRQGTSWRMRDRDLSGMPCRESGDLSSDFWNGRGKGEGERGKERKRE